MKFGPLLKRILDESEVSQSELARRLHILPMRVSEWVTGRVSAPRRDTLKKIAVALDIPVDQLMGDGEVDGTVLPGPILDAAIPVYAHCRAGPGDSGAPVAGSMIGTLPAPRSDADAGVFAVQVAGDSMAPKIEAGDYVLLWPANGPPPPDGTICLVCVEGWAECTLKAVRHGPDGKMLLCSLNPAVPTVEVDPAITPARIVGIYRGLVRLDRPLKP